MVRDVIYMNLSQLRYFVRLAHTRHYTKAARELFISQPSLSHAIAQLEAELGVVLFEKNGRNTTLTAYGEEFLTSVEGALSTLDQGVENLRHTARGEGVIRLGLLRTLGAELVPDLVARFLSTCPGRDLHFTFTTGATPALLNGLLEQQFDLVFSSHPPARLGLTADVVFRQDLVVIVPPGHPLAGRERISLEETLPYPQIFFSESSGLRSVVEELFATIGASPQIAYEVEEDQVIAGLVAKNFGIAVVPNMDILKRLNLRVLQITQPSWERNFYLICNQQRYIPPAVAQFRQFVLEHNSPADGVTLG